jgi:hypothetical protein
MPERDTAKASRSGIGTGRLALLVLAGVTVAVAWLVATELDGRGHTETLEGVRPVGAVHLADGELVFAEPDGRVVSYDIAQRQTTTLLEGLAQPIAADIGPDGTACAVDRPFQPEGSAWLTCTSGLHIDLGAFEIPPLGESPRDRAAWLADIVSDGASGWIVADRGRTALLHVERDGTVAIVVRIRQRVGVTYAPLGLTRKGNALIVALGQGGFSSLTVTDRDDEITSGRYVAGDDCVAVAATEVWYLPLVLVRTGDDSGDFVTSPSDSMLAHPRVAERLYRATGLALLPDGRLAIAANGQLLLVRP